MSSLSSRLARLRRVQQSRTLAVSPALVDSLSQIDCAELVDLSSYRVKDVQAILAALREDQTP